MEITKLMPTILSYILESSTILMVFYLFYYFFLSKEASFKFNRYYLLLTPVASSILPILSLPAIYFSEAAPVSTTYSLLLPDVEIYPFIARNLTAPNIMTWAMIAVYVIGLAISAYGFIRQLYTLRNLKNNSRKENWDGHEIVLTNGLYPTFSFLSTIYYDEKTPLPKESKAMVLLHESMHIKEYHSVDIILSQLICTVFWFNPLYRLYLNAIRLNHEYIVDAQVLATASISKPAYKKSLAASTLYSPYLNIGTFFNKSQILTRMKMMNQTPKSIKSTKLLALSILTTCLIFVFSCENNEANLSGDENMPMTQQGAAGVSEDKKATSDEVFTIVEEQPTFQGEGHEAFMEYISKNIQYPEEAIQKEIQGRVYVQFVIEKDGSVTNVEVVKGVDGSVDEEAKRVVESSPKWTPGKQKGVPVKVRMVIPIQFSLS